MQRKSPNIVVVKRETRFDDLMARWVSPALAAFRLERAHDQESMRRHDELSMTAPTRDERILEAVGFAAYESEDTAYEQCISEVRQAIEVGLPVKMLDRALLPTFDFWNTLAVVVVGQDGLVANTAKYVGEAPIVGVNPDPGRYDGVLLPFGAHSVGGAVRRVVDGRYPVAKVTFAEARLNDGQNLLGFNDLFIGCRTHVSARYTIEFGGHQEAHSSSGVLVSTGAGATGWFSSVFNMAAGIARFGGGDPPAQPKMQWGDRRLYWAVREPFRSRRSGCDMVIGALEEGQELVLESMMPKDGVIFSDGIESDCLEFNTGSIATVTVSKKSARLMLPN